MNSLSLCTFPWWISWFLPFLLGLALGWALWSGYKYHAIELEEEASNLKEIITVKEAEVKNKNRKITDLEGNISIAKKKIRATEFALEKALSKNGND
jgi:hypothetical protein